MASRARSTEPTRAAPGRIVIDDVTPVVAGGRWPVKRVTGEPVSVEAVVFADGHDLLHCAVGHQAPGGRSWTLAPMVATNPGLDRWQGEFVPVELGTHRFRV